jgi:hypothetical protein
VACDYRTGRPTRPGGHPIRRCPLTESIAGPAPYVLLLSGALSMFLASNAFQAGSLAASQPGLTIVDPLVASVLGVLLFGERLDHPPVPLAGEGLALALLVGSVILLGRSPLVRDEGPAGSPPPPTDAPATTGRERSPTWSAGVRLGTERARINPFAPHSP